MKLDLDEALDVARRAVLAAHLASLRHFRSGVEVETKADRSPVTAADREAEAQILAIIQDAFPDHNVLAEESGARDSKSRYRWYVDPIDGTRGFTRGGKFWGSLVALEEDADIVVGAMTLPALGETYSAARGRGCFLNDQRLFVSAIEKWEDATLSVGELRPLLDPAQAAKVVELIRTAASTRCYGDLAGAALVLTGRAEAWIEDGVKPWDIAATRILVEEAGGRFTNFRGGTSLEDGNAIVSNGRVHDHILRTLGFASKRGG